LTLDRANRGFVLVGGLSFMLGGIVLCGALGEVLIPLVVHGVEHGRSLHSGLTLLPFVLFTALVIAGLVFALRSLVSQLAASSRLSRWLDAAAGPAPEGLRGTALEVNLADRLVLIESEEPFSFVYGLLTPRVAVSTALCATLSDDELRAVLVHEEYHVRNLDPLKATLSRVLTDGLFFLPVLGLLRSRYAADRELAADRRAVAACGRGALAGALLRVVRGPDGLDLDVATGLVGDGLLDLRVRQLEEGRKTHPEVSWSRAVLFSMLGAGAMMATFLVSVVAFGGAGTVDRLTGGSLLDAVLSGAICAIPVALVASLGLGLAAFRARRPI
jgi:Zn-dependent protease with chaperone function